MHGGEKRVCSWRLNKAELAELAAPVEKGEDQAVVEREIQTKKAQANEGKAANAVAEKWTSNRGCKGKA